MFIYILMKIFAQKDPMRRHYSWCEKRGLDFALREGRRGVHISQCLNTLSETTTIRCAPSNVFFIHSLRGLRKKNTDSCIYQAYRCPPRSLIKSIF